MNLSWTRPIKELQEVLLDPKALGPETAYWIFSNITNAKWKFLTVITPGLYGNEFPKTYGHYHPPNTLETYKLISGKGFLQLQKKHFEGDLWIPEMVDEVLFVKFEPSEELVLPELWGHSMSNVGPTPLLNFDDWKYDHTPTDYAPIKALHGMAYYIINEEDVKFVPNPNYKNLPDPKVVTVEEAKAILGTSNEG